MSQHAYITDLASFLPNAPVTNDMLDAYWGKASGVAARIRRTTLSINGIATRHYALDPVTGRATHTNAQLASEAVRRLKPCPEFALQDIRCLACGSSTPDLLAPGLASMVHAELGCPPLEIASTAGVCGAGMAALRYASAVVASGQQPNAVATGSEQVSTFFKCQCRPAKTPTRADAEHLERNRSTVFGMELLNWMLSDGAGAAFLAPRPAEGRLSLRIEWIEGLSFAHDMALCMYSGGMKTADGQTRYWREFASAEAAAAAGCFAVQQDIELLNRAIMPTVAGRALPGIMARRGLKAEDVDWFLPHYSSEYFRKPLETEMIGANLDIPAERWFTTLSTRGNMGSASIYAILDDLYRSGRLRQGQRLLCFVPESGRFSVHYVFLTVV
jgi:3-oxoacyl-[acyl-carrier-protein] synthase-3